MRLLPSVCHRFCTWTLRVLRTSYAVWGFIGSQLIYRFSSINLSLKLVQLKPMLVMDICYVIFLESHRQLQIGLRGKLHLFRRTVPSVTNFRSSRGVDVFYTWNNLGSARSNKVFMDCQVLFMSVHVFCLGCWTSFLFEWNIDGYKNLIRWNDVATGKTVQFFLLYSHLPMIVVFGIICLFLCVEESRTCSVCQFWFLWGSSP